MIGTGIIALGACVPRLRLQRRTIVQAHAWANPGRKVLDEGARSICSHDEDSITMAVAAARAALRGTTQADVSALLFASTSMPFADRQNATIIGEALSLRDDLQTGDLAGSQRAGTSALLLALQNCTQRTLVVASDKNLTKPGSVQELTAGDGAAALLIGSDNLLARCLGTHAISRDLVDHYRSKDARFDYRLEERWVRDEGHLKIVAETVGQLLRKTDIAPRSVDHLIIASIGNRAGRTIARQCGIVEPSVVDNAQAECGDTGCAHGLLVLTRALQRANPGEKILLAGFGQGCEALLFEATEAVAAARDYYGLDAALADGVPDDNYLRFLSFNRLVEMEWGIRAERDNRTAQSAFYRHRRSVTSFMGARCSSCNAVQFPRGSICVNPQCLGRGPFVDEPFRDKVGQVKSFTEDWLAHSFSPPFRYGNVRFADGAVVTMEFAEFAPGQLHVGAAVRMQFRIKDHDAGRAFHRYFWKATPGGTGG